MVDNDRIGSSLVVGGRLGIHSFSWGLRPEGLSLVRVERLVVSSLVEWWMMLKALVVAVVVGRRVGLCLRLLLRRLRPGHV